MPQKQLSEIASRHAGHLEMLKQGYVDEYDKFFVEMAKDIKLKLSDVNLTEFTIKRLNALLADVTTNMGENTRAMFEQYQGQLQELGEYEAQFEARSLDSVAKVGFVIPASVQVRAAIFNTPLVDIVGANGGKLLESFFTDWQAGAVENVQNAIRKGFYAGETSSEIIANILGKRDKGMDRGVFSIMRREMEAVVRTGLQHAASQARGATWEANKKYLHGYKIVVTFDRRTSDICRAIDTNKVREIGHDIMPPFHVRCRSGTLAAINPKFADLEKGATRAAKNMETGKTEFVDAKETYYEMLKRQSPAMQDSIVGATRGKLLRDGGITPQRFAELQLDKNFRPITLEEMRNLEPLAFERAGI